MQFLNGGKVKDVYSYDDVCDSLLFRFSDRVSAYDVKFSQDIPRKGEVLCKFAEFWFEKLQVPSHFVRRESNTDIVVKKMKMLPIECVVRGYLYGSLYDRWKAGKVDMYDDGDHADDRDEDDHTTDHNHNYSNLTLASKLPNLIFDPTTKSEHDIPIDKKTAIAMGLVSNVQYDWLKKQSISIYEKIAAIADSAGFILADLKLEFGIPVEYLNDDKCKICDLDTSHIMLGDSIGPDEYRLWPKETFEPGRTQISYDKQILRDWLADNGYKTQFEQDRNSGKTPVAPTIPDDVISKMTQRYVDSFERIAGVAI